VKHQGASSLSVRRRGRDAHVKHIDAALTTPWQALGRKEGGEHGHTTGWREVVGVR
jgi:hypothetical protein